MKSSTAGKDDTSQSLLDYVISKGPLKERKVRLLVQQLAQTLSLLHKHGVVHRNLKLENIYVGPTGRAILTDFARATTFSGLLTECTSTQFSPAPELLLPTPTANTPQVAPYAAAPVDVWGLGVVLHTLACHAVPFDRPTVAAMHEASQRSPEGVRFPARVSGGPCVCCPVLSSSSLEISFSCRRRAHWQTVETSFDACLRRIQ